MNANLIPAIQIQGITAETLIGQIKEVLKDLNPTQQPQTTTDKLLTRKEVCKLLQVSLVTVHNWTKQGILNPYRIGNKLRFKESEVLEALQAVNPKNV
ncbi:helix-turn-helix domain-containing protein [Tenacibaculum sp. M341]|uniref:helix-turn-helix domain-containing protein n=1 Tax=Tenacibaculum sp. M341 TaxID=2530339 RepID=UPI001051503A|nr:helix-turn-helix domain-containing protein [Tenacibaculum sp. M341]TCI85322.1 DNA-binding protein [Tenacibaculum sp. M341]